MAPREFDLISFPEMIQVLRAVRDEELMHSRLSAMMATFVYNYGGMRGPSFRPKSPKDLFPKLYDGKSRGEKIMAGIEAGLKQQAIYEQQLAAKAARLKQERENERTGSSKSIRNARSEDN